MRPSIVIPAPNLHEARRPSLEIERRDLVGSISISLGELADKGRPLLVIGRDELDQYGKPAPRWLYIGPIAPDALPRYGQTVPAVIDRNSTFLYRGDSRPPADIFANGFKCWGNQQDVGLHVGSARGSTYIPTSKLRRIAKGFTGSGGYVYLIRNDKASGIDLNATFGARANPCGYEQEVAFYREIAPHDVLLARASDGRVLVNDHPRAQIPRGAWTAMGAVAPR